jgi:ribonuclease HI
MQSLRINTDGGARGNPGPAAIGVVVTDEHKKIIHSHNAYLGAQTNNVAEYEALLYALHWLERFSATTQLQKCDFFLDSKLVIEQVNGNWRVKEIHLQKYVLEAMNIIRSLPFPITLSYVPRAQNADADALVNAALDVAPRS